MKETIGQQLRQAREAQKLALNQVASATHMRERYLRALEEGTYEMLPSMAQARGFLRTYASYLKLDPEPLIEALDGEGSTGQAGVSPPKPAAPANGNPPVSYEEADQIFADVGRQLQYQRELLGLSLDDVVRYTHLRRHYLQALESGSLNDLPSPVQGRGMLDNYAVFLGMDPEPLLLRFAEGLQARLSARKVARVEPDTQPKPRRRRPLPAPLRRLLSPDVLIGVTFAIFLVIFIGWGVVRIFSLRAAQPVSLTPPSIADILLATPVPSQTPTLSPGTPIPVPAQPTLQVDLSGADATAAIAPPSAGGPGVQVYLTITQRAWIRAIVDGKVEFEGRVIPGSAYPFVGESIVEILTSNGAAVQVFFNQQDMGALGSFGEVVNRIYTPQGVLTPTPTITRTPTATLRAAPSATAPNIPAGEAPALP